MSKLYLHIGIEKTGSTAIQKYLATYKNIIFNKKKVYPYECFNSDNHMELSSLVLPSHYLINMKIPKKIAVFRDTLIEFIQRNQHNDIYFSSEHLSSRVVKIQEISALLEILLSAGHDLVVVAFYRKPEEWINSHYLQYIASGGTLSFKSYIEDSLKDTFIARTTNYANALLNWQLCVKNIGGSVTFKDYNLCKKNLIEQYCSLVDLKFIPQAKSLNSNPSYSESQIRLIGFYNKFIRSKKHSWRFKRIISKAEFTGLKVNWTAPDYSKYIAKQTELFEHLKQC